MKTGSARSHSEKSGRSQKKKTGSVKSHSEKTGRSRKKTDKSKESKKSAKFSNKAKSA